MKNSFLIGERICLRALVYEDLKGGYVRWLNDPEVCKYNSHHVFPYTDDMALDYIKFVHRSKENLVLAIVLKKDDIHIGNISLQEINYVNRNAELAVILGEKSCWGKGYAKEASVLIVKHGFKELNLHRIYCGTSVDNVPMQKLALYLGMEKEGYRRDAVYKGGHFRDIVEYGVLKDGFLAKFNLTG